MVFHCRELQRKYAASTEPSTASKAPMHSISGLERTEDGKEQTDFTDAPTPAIIGEPDNIPPKLVPVLLLTLMHSLCHVLALMSYQCFWLCYDASGRKLAYLALEMPGGALRDPPNEDLQQGEIQSPTCTNSMSHHMHHPPHALWQCSINIGNAVSWCDLRVRMPACVCSQESGPSCPGASQVLSNKQGSHRQC